MSDKDQIKDLFSEKLGSFEAKVNPDLWANVASQVGAASGAAAGTSGMSLLTKAIIGISGAAVVTTGVVLYTNSETPDPKTKETPVTIDSPSQEKDNETPKEDTKTFVVENNATVNNGENSTESPVVPVEPERSIAPTMGPGDGGDTNIVTNLTVIPEPKKPTIQELMKKAGEKDITEARNSDIKNLEEELLTKEDDPLNGITTQTPKEEEEAISLEIPNIFTPDGDGVNDEYHLNNIDGINFESFEFVIYDRTGNPVMISKDAKFTWTGYDPMKGRLVEKGQYMYVLVAVTEKGTPIKRTGTIKVSY